MDDAADTTTSKRAAARAILETRGIPFDEQRALDYVRKGDEHTVELLLVAGIDSNASDHNGVPAVVIAARQRNRDICRLLIAHGADPGRLVDAVSAASGPKKDLWERLASIGGVLTFVSSVIIALVGWHFTNAYNERQQLIAEQQAKRDAEIRTQQTRISEMDTVVKMIPHLTQGEQSKRAALLALSALATPQLAVQMAQLFGGVGSVQALETIANQQTATKPGAVSALAGIASRPGGVDTASADAANEALAGIFKGKERSLVTVLADGQFTCNGFVVDVNGPSVLTPTYCVSQSTPARLRLRLWDDTQLAVQTVTIRGPVAVLAAQKLTTSMSLSLASAIPPSGSRMLKIAYGVALNAASTTASPSLSVLSGQVEGTASLPSFDGGSAKHDGLRVRFPNGKRAPSGQAGGPILDSSGAVACMVYAAGTDSDVEECLPSTVLRQSISAASAQ